MYKVTLKLNTAVQMAMLLQDNVKAIYTLKEDRTKLTEQSLDALFNFLDENFSLVTDRIDEGVIHPVSIEYLKQEFKKDGK